MLLFPTPPFFFLKGPLGVPSFLKKKMYFFFKKGLSRGGFRRATTPETHFYKYTLLTKKRADFILFKTIIILMSKKEHLQIEGLKKIIL